MKKVKNKAKLVAIVVLTILALFGLVHGHKNKARIDSIEILEEATIPYSSTLNFRQTVNDCGPFNVAAIVRIIKEREVSSSTFAKEIGWRLPNKYTLPQGLESLLGKNDVKFKTPNVNDLSDEDKMKYLKQELSKKHPIIILGARDEFVGSEYQHYITLLGFNNKEDIFYVYDPFYTKSHEGMTIDSNGEKSGNRNYKEKDLLEFWKKGGMYGLYTWYLIVAEK